MRAAVATAYGDPRRVVEVREVERPEPVDDQLLVRVHAASVNRADLDYLGPRPSIIRPVTGMRGPRTPRIGLDAAGTVERVGPAATRFAPGDRVFADLFPFGSGAFAEYVVAPERAFAPIPSEVTFEHAATLPHSAILAVQGLRTRRGRTIQPGDRVLIDGASGNVGPFAVQIAQARGAHVTGVCHGSKADFVRSLGAEQVIDYTTADYTRTGEQWDWILASDAHYPVGRISRALRPGGVYVTLGGDNRGLLSSALLAPLIGRVTGRSMGLLLWWRPFDRTDLTGILELVIAGTVRPAIDCSFPLTEVGAALGYVADGHPRGKVLVIP